VGVDPRARAGGERELVERVGVEVQVGPLLARGPGPAWLVRPGILFWLGLLGPELLVQPEVGL